MESVNLDEATSSNAAKNGTAGARRARQRKKKEQWVRLVSAFLGKRLCPDLAVRIAREAV